MKDKPCWFLFVLAISAGFVGGALGNWLLAGKPVFAQKSHDRAGVFTEEKADMFIARKGFFVVDENDTIRAGMMLAENGRVSIYVWGIQGESRIDMGVTPHGASSLEFYDNNGRLRANLAVGGNPRGIFATGKYDANSSSLQLYDDNGSIRALLGSTDTQYLRIPQRPVSSLVLFDRAFRPIWSAPEEGGTGRQKTERIWGK